MSGYSETVEERDGYRVRLEVEDCAEKPYDDGATPILTIERSGYGGYSVEAFNSQAEPYTSAVAEVLDRHDLDTVERFVKIFYGATKMDSFWSEGIRGYYVAFDTEEWRETTGATPALLKDENYLSEVEAWANGEVYGHIVEKFDAESDDWEEVADGSCWGFYGHAYAEEAARQALTDAIAWDKAHPTPAAVPAPVIECVPERLSLKDEAERLLSYWEAHGDKPETVEKWAISDMMGILRYILEDEA